MSRIFKKKKGDGGFGFGVIIAIVIILLSAGVILLVIQSTASKADEKTRIDVCRISNEIRVGTEDKTLWFIHSPRICDTIYKTDSKLQVPTKIYRESYVSPGDAAKAEIGDMLKNCWYMWLEGSDPKVFEMSYNPLAWGRNGCHICYIFKIKNEAKDAFKTSGNFNGYNILVESLQQRTFVASDSSDKCAPNIGGFLEASCADPWKEVPSKMADAQTDSNKRHCCIKINNLDECGNKGGECYVPGNQPPEFPRSYSKWSCPANQLCYVREANYYSYWKYITDYGKRGGTLVLVTGTDVNANGNGNFVDNVGAISIYSGKDDNSNGGNAFLRISSMDYAGPGTDRQNCEIV